MITSLKNNSFFIFIIIVFFLTMNYNKMFAEVQKGKLIVNINGFKNSKGSARILLFDRKNASGFPKEIEMALGKVIVPIKDNKVIYTFDNLPFGDYAVSVHHDEDNDGKIKKNLIGIPSEPLGSSNDAKGNFGPPSFEQAKVMLYIEKLSIVINMVN